MEQPHMPRPASESTPKYRKHRASGQAIVTLTGRDVYLGPHGSASSKKEYDRVIAEWLSNDRRSSAQTHLVTLVELIAAYWRHVESYYRKDGKPTSEVSSIRDALRQLKDLYGHTPAAEFGPLRLKTVRDRMIQRGWVRGSINRHIHRIKRMFAWAVENELLQSSVYEGLRVVAGLRAGRSQARESEPIRPVDDGLVDATIEQVGPVIGAMIELQRLTGMRSGELTSMRGCDLDTSGKLWSFRPSSHKTQHHGFEKVVWLGPQAQAVIRPFLKADLSAYLFSPCDAEGYRRAQMRGQRKTRVQPSQRDRRKRRPLRTPGDRYDTKSYKRAIARGYEKAFPLPEPLRRLPGEKHGQWKARMTPTQLQDVDLWRKAHSWHPHQLRHNAATRLRKQFGIEAARVVLGHRSASVTEIYAEMDQQKAAEIMAQVG